MIKAHSPPGTLCAPCCTRASLQPELAPQASTSLVCEPCVALRRCVQSSDKCGEGAALFPGMVRPAKRNHAHPYTWQTPDASRRLHTFTQSPDMSQAVTPSTSTARPAAIRMPLHPTECVMSGAVPGRGRSAQGVPQMSRVRARLPQLTFVVLHWASSCLRPPCEQATSSESRGQRLCGQKSDAHAGPACEARETVVAWWACATAESASSFGEAEFESGQLLRLSCAYQCFAWQSSGALRPGSKL